MSEIELALAFLSGVVMGILLDRWLLPPLVDVWSTSAWRTPQNRSVMPFVYGEFMSVRRAGSGAPRASCRGA